MSARLVGALVALVALVGMSGCAWNERPLPSADVHCWSTATDGVWCGDFATGNAWKQSN